ncbi:MAG: cation diffusion facilitator family transporter [Chloroflexota bacterium]|nr:cation diffusion facilitator family transporter [Chloroflexota bacterium]
MDTHSRRITRVASLAILTNALLVIGKLIVGFGTGSVAILSEAAHSGVDLLVAVLASAAIWYAQRPADRTHPYGHGKVETLTSFGEGILIGVVAVFSAGNAINALVNGSVVTHVGWGIAIMTAAAVINTAISRYLLRIARSEGSPALEATGIELGTDVITATGVVLGLLVVQVTGRHVVDPIVGIIVSGFIAVAGIRVLLGAIRGLMDYRLPDEEERTIRTVLDDHADNFIEYHDLRTRHVGGRHAVDLHLVVPSDLSVAAAHDLSSHLEDEIADALPQTDIVIHIEPENEAATAHPSGAENVRPPAGDTT